MKMMRMRMSIWAEESTCAVNITTESPTSGTVRATWPQNNMLKTKGKVYADSTAFHSTPPQFSMALYSLRIRSKRKNVSYYHCLQMSWITEDAINPRLSGANLCLVLQCGGDQIYSHVDQIFVFCRVVDTFRSRVCGEDTEIAVSNAHHRGGIPSINKTDHAS